MKFAEIASRYAKALFELSTEANEQVQVLAEMKIFSRALQGDKEIHEFVTSPVLSLENKVKVFETLISDLKLSVSTKSFVLLLASKGRMGIFTEIMNSFEMQLDSSNGVSRGHVRSATALSTDDRQRIEKIVSEFTHKKVILSYQEDKNVIGGLKAEVDSYCFDDTIITHLRRLKEQVNRSTH